MDLSICYPAAIEREIGPLQTRLARITGQRPLLLPCADAEPVTSLWEDAQDAAAALLVIVPAILPASNRAAWGALLSHVESARHPPVAFLEWSPCSVPAALRRAPWFSTAELRALEAWLITLKPDARPHRFLAAAQPAGALLPADFDLLARELIDQPGRAETSTSTAQQFARQSAAYFLDVVWISAAGRSEAALLDDLTRDLELDFSLDCEAAWTGIGQALDLSRRLLVLHEASFDGALALSPSQRGSLLLAHDAASEPPVERLTPDAALLLDACSLFRPGRIPARAASQVAALPDPPFEELVRTGWLILLERGHYRLAHPVPPAADIELHRRFLDLAFGGLLDDTSLDDWMPEAVPAFHLAVALDCPFARRFAERAAAVLERNRRFHETIQLWRLLLAEANQRADEDLQRLCTRELGWLTGEGGPHARPVEPGEQQSFDFG